MPSTVSRQSLRGLLSIWYVLVPAAISLALGLWGIVSSSLWYDELQTADALESGLLTHLWEAPLLPYYGGMWLWTLGGTVTDDGWMRMSSVLAIVAAVVCVALAARRLTNARGGFAAGLVLALSPAASRYSQEARVYAAATAAIALATLAFVAATQHDRRSWWVTYSLSLALAGLILPVSFAAIPAHAAILTGLPDWRRHRRPWLMACMCSVPIAVLELVALGRFTFMHDWLSRPAPTDFPVGVLLPMIGDYYENSGIAYAAAIVILAAVSPLGRRWLLGAIAGVGCVWLVSVGLMSWWTGRSLLPLSVLLAIAAGVSLSRTLRWQLGAAAVVLTAVSIPAHVANRQPDARGPNIQNAAMIVDQFGRPGDVILADSTHQQLSWAVAHYLRDDPRFAHLPDAAGRRWLLGNDSPCDRAQVWTVPGGGILRLCS
jgi:mannosyltransferase